MKREIINVDPSQQILCNTKELQGMTGCGRDKATEIGTAAGAKVQIGRRVLWNVSKVREYLDAISA